MSILLIQGDARKIPLADQSVHCCVTSPPYWGLRDYGVAGQLGLEKTAEEYTRVMVDVFREVKRVLRGDGTLWLNIGDSYASAWPAPNTRRNIIDNPMSGGKRGPGRPERMGGDLKEKDLVGIPWMLAFALRADGWYLRSDIIWSKPNPMPESVTDRPTKAHEYIFLLSKSREYYYDAEAIKEESVSLDLRKPYAPGQIDARGNGHDRGGGSIRKNAVPTGCLPVKRNKRTVWEVNPQPFPEAHFATFPEELIKPCILAGCPLRGTVLDPFIGSGTTALVARNLQCHAIGLEINPKYIDIARGRLAQKVMSF